MPLTVGCGDDYGSQVDQDRLAGDADFLRVDLILSEGRIPVGELTNYPNAGRVGYRPADFDCWLGEFWTRPERYRDLPRGNYPA